MFVLLCQAGRLLFKPSALTENELSTADRLLQGFCISYFTHLYARQDERLRFCRPTRAAILDVTQTLRSCGPPWS